MTITPETYFNPCLPPLADKLSDAIDQIITDVEFMLTNGNKFVPSWWATIKNDHCEVCLAGAVLMRRSLFLECSKHDQYKLTMKTSYDPLFNKIDCIDSLRYGKRLLYASVVSGWYPNLDISVVREIAEKLLSIASYEIQPCNTVEEFKPTRIRLERQAAVLREYDL